MQPIKLFNVAQLGQIILVMFYFPCDSGALQINWSFRCKNVLCIHVVVEVVGFLIFLNLLNWICIFPTAHKHNISLNLSSCLTEPIGPIGTNMRTKATNFVITPPKRSFFVQIFSVLAQVISHTYKVDQQNTPRVWSWSGPSVTFLNPLWPTSLKVCPPLFYSMQMMKSFHF